MNENVARFTAMKVGLEWRCRDVLNVCRQLPIVSLWRRSITTTSSISGSRMPRRSRWWKTHVATRSAVARLSVCTSRKRHTRIWNRIVSRTSWRSTASSSTSPSTCGKARYSCLTLPYHKGQTVLKELRVHSAHSNIKTPLRSFKPWEYTVCHNHILILWSIIHLCHKRHLQKHPDWTLLNQT